MIHMMAFHSNVSELWSSLLIAYEMVRFAVIKASTERCAVFHESRVDRTS